jgi:hypothetical protein
VSVFVHVLVKDLKKRERKERERKVGRGSESVKDRANE